MGVGPSNDQPMTRGRWIIAFVGEVLDFRETHPHLKCDAQMVADLWDEKGPSCLVGRDGFWHVVAYDTHLHQLHLLCDYLAQKPLYYRTDFGACASEPMACAKLGPTTFDEIYLSSVIKWGYCPEPWRTPFKEVRRVLPGEHVVLSEERKVCSDFVDPLEPINLTVPELKVEIEEAIRRRVESSDVPVACLLSGGLDSSIVYTIATRYGDVRPYYVRGDEPDYEELMNVTRVLKSPATGVMWTGVKDIDALGIMQEPIDLGSLIPQCALSGAVKETVCLTGDGADELFGGYGRAQRYDSQQTDIFHELVCWHLPRLDRVMMNNLVEVRSPFLARRVAGAALRLPRELRMGKKVLREMFLKDLPEEIIYQKKKPLRIETDREARSEKLVRLFKQMCS